MKKYVKTYSKGHRGKNLGLNFVDMNMNVFFSFTLTGLVFHFWKKYLLPMVSIRSNCNIWWKFSLGLDAWSFQLLLVFCQDSDNCTTQNRWYRLISFRNSESKNEKYK